MTPDARSTLAFARDAYVFTYPLVMNYRTMYMQAIKGEGRRPVHRGSLTSSIPPSARRFNKASTRHVSR
jgi:hypothetical protein